MSFIVLVASAYGQAEKETDITVGEVKPVWSYTGAVVGTVTGFGIGYVFQQRYAERMGYIFTAIDVVSVFDWRGFDFFSNTLFLSNLFI